MMLSWDLVMGAAVLPEFVGRKNGQRLERFKRNRRDQGLTLGLESCIGIVDGYSATAIRDR